MLLSETDRQYKSLCNRIGAALLVFYLIFNILSAGIIFAREKIYAAYPSDLVDLAFSLADYAVYLFAFMFPVLFFRLISKKHAFPKMHLEFKVSKKLWLIIPAALGINFFVAEINHLLLLPINFSEVIAQPVPESYHAHNFVLDVIGTAIVPAICEEFLFRGLILSALLPYGKKTAIFGSAILFSLMHQNPAQILYTVVLGVIFAQMVIDSGSIWGGIILHFVNNFVSVVMNAIIYTCKPELADLLYMIIFLGIMAIGLIISGILITRYFIRRARQKRESALRREMMPSMAEKGLFGVDKLYGTDSDEPLYKLSPKYAIKGFFAPCNVIFTVLAICNMLLLIGMAIFIRLGGSNGLQI